MNFRLNTRNIALGIVELNYEEQKTTQREA